MRYLVTGGLGVIGSLISRELLRRGYDVLILDDGASKRHALNWESVAAESANAELTLLKCSTESLCRHETDPVFGHGISDIDLGVVDLVIHAGASTGIPYSSDDPNDDWRRNAEGTRVLLEWLRSQDNPPPTVVLSSVKPLRVIDPRISPPEAAKGRPLTGHEPMEADEPYAASKAAQTALCQCYGRSLDVPVAVLRCSNLWGPAACHGPRHGWLTWFCICAAVGWPLEVQGTGQQARDMLWWVDVLNMCDKAHTGLRRKTIPPGSVLTIGGGVKNMTTVGQAARKLHKLTGCEITYAPEKARRNEDEWVAVDNAAASRMVTSWGGFEPSVDVDTGLRLMLEWAREHADELREAYGSA